MIYCYQSYCIEQPLFLLLFVPFFILLLFLLFKTFINFGSKDEKKLFASRKRMFRIMILATRTLILIMILTAAARPFTTVEGVTRGDPVIKVLIDDSRSMDVFEDDILEKVKEKLPGVQLDIQQISSGERSELGEGIIRRIEGNDNLLLITDGNNNFGKNLIDVGVYSRISDTRLFALDIEPENNDAYVTISGPAETIEGTQNRFKVEVEYSRSEPAFTLQVYIDDTLEFTGKNVFEKEILKSFSRGYHKITAKIILDDYFKENNVFYKTVKAVPKPKVLFVNKKYSPLQEGLKGIYELREVSKLPSDFSSYSAVIFNDISYGDISSRVDDLTGYLLKGNGLLFIGGRNSFDKGSYKGTLLESMLPVDIGTGRILDPLQHNIVIALDVSESFSDYSFKEGGTNSALDFGKGLATRMVEDFRDDIKVGLVAFATIGQVVMEPVELKDNRDLLTTKIKMLGKGEGTSIEQGLVMAEKALEKVKGTKNVILISDGKMGHIELPIAPITWAQRLSDNGVRIYTVGLPSALYDVDVNRKLMTKLAEIGNGNYFEPSEYQYLNVFFGKPDVKDKIFSGVSNLAIIDRNHFITNGLDLSAKVTGINFVVPKVGARSLIFTGDGNPVVNSWNFGLGRVVTIATDDGSEWAGELLKRESSMLITRTINYAVGNPEKDKDIYVSTHDSYLGEASEIKVKSDKYPVSKELTFVKEGEDLYTADFSADESGFFQFFDAVVAVNPPKEYYSIGSNNELREAVSISGGKMLNLDEKGLVEEIKTYSERIEQQRKDLSFYPLGVALVIFIIELVLRKIFASRKQKLTHK